MPPPLTENKILIQAPVSRVFDLVCSLPRWQGVPGPLRQVHVMEQNARQSIVEIRAWARPAGWRAGFPCRWIGAFRPDAGARVLRCEYLEPSPWRGLWAEWRFEETALGTQLTVRHRRRGTPSFWQRIRDSRWVAPRYLAPLMGELLVSFKIHMEAS